MTRSNFPPRQATPEQQRELRRKREWSTEDYALYFGFSHKVARARLETLNREVMGVLLKKRGERRPWRFYLASLVRLCPELFEPIESLEIRVEALEDANDTLRSENRKIASAVGQINRDFAKMRGRKKAA